VKHAGPDTRESLAWLLRQLRAIPALIERRPGVFYVGSRAARPRTMTIRVARHFVLLCLGWCCAHTAVAQSLAPRAYVITPTGYNVIDLQYAYQDGSLQFPGGVPITGATADINLVALSYYHSLGLLGRSANLTFALPYASGDFKGTLVDVPKSFQRSGSLDSVARFSVNLLGGPEMSQAEFAKWHQDVLLGMSLTIVAPTGQYDDTRLINWGSNRWAFKPEIGYSQRWRNWVLDAYGGAWFYTKDDEFFSHNMYFPGVHYQTEDTVEEAEAHLSYDVRPRLWISFDANYWRGGATSLNGVENPATNQKSSRVGITASVPLTAHQSMKLSVSDGAYARYGGNYKSISAAWQYGWLGWNFH
jgi:hypothetical protein